MVGYSGFCKLDTFSLRGLKEELNLNPFEFRGLHLF